MSVNEAMILSTEFQLRAVDTLRHVVILSFLQDTRQIIDNYDQLCQVKLLIALYLKTCKCLGF